MDDGEGSGFSWESRYAQSWDVLREDSAGTLQPTLALLVQRDSAYLQRRRAAGGLRRGLLRHVVLLVDWSAAASAAGARNASTPMDASASARLLRRALGPFVRAFFEQNPVAQLAIVVLREGLAAAQSQLSASVADHDMAVSKLLAEQPAGDMSLHNGLRVARGMLAHVPAHGTREVVVLHFALATVDAGDLFAEVSALKDAGVRVSAVSHAGELSVIARLCRETGGACVVALNDDHFCELVSAHVTPPEVSTTRAGQRALSHLVPMGFPAAHGRPADARDACACHGKPLVSVSDGGGYSCPRCSARACHLPCDCAVCGLTLVAAPHLAKSYHHLFPVAPFLDLPGAGLNGHASSESSAKPAHHSGGHTTGSSGQVPGGGSECYGCRSQIELGPVHRSGYGPGACPRCHRVFCHECNYFVHERLHNCPGCM